MTQCNEKSTRKNTELAKLFLTLNETNQDSALHILKALKFAQSILYDHSPKTSEQHT